MRVKALAGSLVLLAAAGLLSPAHAAMAPLYETAREIASILQDPGLANAVGGGYRIISVTATAPDVYEVRTEQCAVTVNIVGIPVKEHVDGPRQYGVVFGAPRCQ